MVIQKKRPYYWTILISLTTALFVYLTLVNVSLDQGFDKAKSFDAGVKKIVSYSLLKQIEIESKPYGCDGQLNLSVNDDNEISESVEVNNNTGRVVGWNDEDQDNNWAKIDGSNLYVSSVNMDKRLGPYHYFRIIGMIKGNWQETFFCQIFTSSDTYHITKVTINPIWSDNWDQNDTNTYYNPVLLSCRVPVSQVPTSVALTRAPCSTTNRRHNFRITENLLGRQNIFTVCVKPLDFLEDISERLIQWIEISRLLGAEKIEIYVKHVQEKVWRILKWYNSTYPGEINIRKFKVIPETGGTNKTRASFLKNIWQKRRYELIAYNNCFYRNIETSQFVIPLDIDEIIVPTQTSTWQSLLGDLFTSSPELQENYASFTVPNAYYFGKLSTNGHGTAFFFRNTFRSPVSPAGESGKSFISTKNSLTVFNHYVLDVLKPGVSRTYFLPSDAVRLNHYKETCSVVILPECVKYLSSPRIKDRGILKFKNAFLDKYFESVGKLRKFGVL